MEGKGSKVAPGAGQVAAETFPDLHHKMSKKIAQLTKVIYHLNTKNEDHNTELENLAASNQLELQQVVRDASAKFAKFKEALDAKQQAVNVEAAMAVLQKKYSAEREGAQKDFQAYKIKMAEREQRLTMDFQKKYDALNEDVSGMNQRFSDKTKAFDAATLELKRALDEARSAGSGALQEIRKKHEGEIAELVKASNSKYQDMLVQQIGLQEEAARKAEADLAQARLDVAAELQARLDAEHEVAIGQLRARLKGDKEEALMSLRRELEERLQQQREDLTGRLDKSQAEVARLQEELAGLRAELAGKEGSLRDLQAQLDETSRHMGDKLGGSEARLQQLTAALGQEKGQTAKLTAELSEREEEIERLHRLLKDKNAKMVELEGLVEASAKEAAALRRDLEAAQAGLAAVDKTLQDKLRASEKTSDALRQELAQLEGSVADRDSKLADLERAAIRLAAENARAVATLQADKDLLLQQLREHTDHLASSGERAREEVDRLAGKLRDLEAQTAREKAELTEKYEKMLESMREAARAQLEVHSKDLSAALEQHAAKEAALLQEAAAARKAHIEEMRAREEQQTLRDAELAARHTSEIDTLKHQLAQLEAQLSHLTESQDSQVNAMKGELSKLETKARAYKAELEAKKKESERAESVQTGLKNQIEALREELKASQKAYRDKMDMGLAKLEADWQAKMDAQRETHEFQLKECEALGEVNKAIEIKELTRQHDEEMQILKNALSREAAQAAGEQSAAERARLQLEAELRDEKQARRAAETATAALHLDEVKTLTAQHATELEEMRKSHSASSSALSSRMEQEHAQQVASLESQLAELRRAHAEELETRLQAQLRSSEEGLQRMLADLDARLTAAHSQTLTRAQDESRAALAAARKEADAQMEHMMVERDHMEQTLNMTLNSLATTEKALSEEKAELARRANNFAQEREQLQRDADLALRQEREASQRQLLEAQDRSAADARLLKEEFSEDRRRFDERLAEAGMELEAMELRYRNRESRQDDLARIAALEQELVDKDELVARTREEMMYFKREMLNREESYNVKFNAKPNVGVMQVLKTSEAPAQGGVKSSKPTRVVQPGPGMGMGMPGLGGMGIGGVGGGSEKTAPPGLPGSTKMPPLPRSK